MTDSLVVNEIYLSVQGESTYAGLPCIFIRLTACPLRCSYCDTAYAFTEGTRIPIDQILTEIDRLAAPYASTNQRERLPLVELTGGEPLAQKKSLRLMHELCERGYIVLLETSGALDISAVHPAVHRIMDLKCPSSGESVRNNLANIAHLKSTDEIKFVIGTQEDYDWARQMLTTHQLAKRCPILFSWVNPLLPHQQDRSLKEVPADHHPIQRRDLVESIIRDALPVRFQLQTHKFIWPPDQRAV